MSNDLSFACPFLQLNSLSEKFKTNFHDFKHQVLFVFTFKIFYFLIDALIFFIWFFFSTLFIFVQF